MMTLLNTVIAEFVGPFVDDEFLAVGIVVVVGITALILRDMPVAANVAAVTLAGGCLAVLVVSVLRTRAFGRVPIALIGSRSR
jgi:hypothetical protein